MIVLSGDVGGTSTRMQLTEFDNNDEMKVLKNFHYSNKNYTNFTNIIKAFFENAQIDEKQINSVCFAVAGPVVNNAVNITNLPWVVELDAIKKQLNKETVALINDFEGIGYGLKTLRPSDLHTMEPGKPRENGLISYIGAGTGLGVGFMTFANGSYIVNPTEGGHVDFAPTDDVQIELLQYMRKKRHRISFERVVSGQGLVHIYHYVRDNKIYGEEENPELRFYIESGQNIDIAATLAEYAIKHKDIMAMRALDIFINIYGTAVGNLALTTLPYGGLYVVGGIAPKLLPQIKSGGFMERYFDKGRMSNLLYDIPLHIVTNTDVGLLGAAMYAKRIAV